MYYLHGKYRYVCSCENDEGKKEVKECEEESETEEEKGRDWKRKRVLWFSMKFTPSRSFLIYVTLG